MEYDKWGNEVQPEPRTFTMIPRGLWFDAKGFCVDTRDPGRPDCRMLVIDLPTDHYDFCGPVPTFGRTLDQINADVAAFRLTHEMR